MTDTLSKDLREFYLTNGITGEVLDLSEKVLKSLEAEFERIAKVCEYNQMRVLAAFKEHKISDTDFSGTSGYGYDDRGRDKIEEVFARIFGAEKAFVRTQISSGTQAIAMALYGILRPGDRLLSVTGRPYDTLMDTIGISDNEGMGSLREFGIEYGQVDFDDNGEISYSRIKTSINENTRMVYIQKSKGYSERRSLLITDIRKIVDTVKKVNKDIIVLVDNCYGEFVENEEPCHAGADICAGSLIKNPGGGLCLTGGYLAGRADLVEMAACRLTAPGIGSHIGPSLGMNRMVAQGLFMAPHAVSQALKGAIFAAAFFADAGCKVMPKAGDSRGDIVQTIVFDQKEKLLDFCQAVQSSSPVDSFVKPEPWDMPGYDHQVIMAAGNFVSGSSIELSCDAPIKTPFTAYMQGGLVFEQTKFACMIAASKMRT